MSAEAKLDKFSAAVLKDAEDQRSKILAEIEEYRKSQMDKAEEEILREAYVMIQNEITSIKNDQTRQISRAELEGRKDLLLHREGLTKKVFDEAASMILDFSKTDDYKKFIIGLFEKSTKDLSKGSIVIGVKKDDLALKDELVKSSGREASVVESQSIRLGGFIITNKDSGLVIDESLDSKLKNQKDWFSAKSGLSIDM